MLRFGFINGEALVLCADIEVVYPRLDIVIPAEGAVIIIHNLRR